MYLTPVIYPMSILKDAPSWGGSFNANPLTAFIKIFRAVVLDGVTPPAILHVQSLVWCAIALIVGSLVFKNPRTASF